MSTEKASNLICSNFDFKQCCFSMKDLHYVKGQFIHIDNSIEGDKEVEQLWFKSELGKLYLIEEDIRVPIPTE